MYEDEDRSENLTMRHELVSASRSKIRCALKNEDPLNTWKSRQREYSRVLCAQEKTRAKIGTDDSPHVFFTRGTGILTRSIVRMT